MQPEAFTYPLLAVALVGGGVFILAHASREVRRQVAARVDLIATVPPGAVAAAPEAHGLIKSLAASGADASVAEVARLCRRLKIDPSRAPSLLIAVRLATGAVLGLAGLAFGRFVFPTPGALVLGVAFGCLAAGAGWALPSLFASHLARRRTAEIVEGFPEALELMVVCVESGLGLEESIDRAAFELKVSQPVLAAELAQTSADMKILPDRDQALRNMADRTRASSVRSVVTALSQTLRYGTPLAQALRVAASELRNESMLKLEERANRLPTLLTLPMMLFIMPTILLVIGGPAIIQVLDLLAK